MLEDCGRNLRYALRRLGKAPGFAAAATLTIALGIGASTAVFSVTDAVLLRPLPYRDAGRLVLVDGILSNPDYFDLRRATAPVFEDVAAFVVYRAIVPREDGSAERISKAQVSANFFRTMGAAIALGRDFNEADGQPQGAVPRRGFPLPEGRVAILSYEYWQRRYGGDAAVIGREIPGTVERGPRIVGVLAPGFRLLLPASVTAEPSSDVWTAYDSGYDTAQRGQFLLRAIARLKAGVPLARAEQQTGAAAAELRRKYYRGSGFDLRIEPMRKPLVAEARPAILALMGAVVFLLLIACANVANLVLVRAALRQREFAIRAALGAGPGRLMRQMLAEAAVISAPATLAGVALAWLGVRGLPAVAPAGVPRLDAVAIDWRVLAFAAVAGIVATTMLGASAAFARDRAEALRVGGSAAVPRRVPALRNAVVVAQVALSFVLLAGSGLMLRSFVALCRVEPGFDSRRTLTFLLIGEPRGFPPQRRLPLLREIQARMRALPGVEDASASAFFPLKRGFAVSLGWATEKNPQPDNSRAAAADYVLPGYFETLRTPVIEGRTFTEEDNAPGRKVAVIDRTLARKAFGNGSAVGKRILVQLAKREWFEVIGVVAHQRRTSLAEPGPEQIYFSDGAMGFGISRHWALRTAGDPAACASAVRAEMAKLAPGLLAVTEVQTVDALVDRARAGTRFELLIIGAMAAIAAALAAVGLYGVLASAVRQRAAEIGVRMALGAAPTTIFRLIAGQGLRLTAAGIAIGAGAAFWLTQWMKSILVGVKPGDIPTYTATAALFLAVAAAACWLPARRAAALDPAAALRQE